MKPSGNSGSAPRISDAAAREKTGRSWDEWFQILDSAGARKKDHREIVDCLRRQHGLGPWWQQMVAVTYEQARGLREKHHKPEGYEISSSRTVGVPLSKLYKAWAKEKTRRQWLSGKPLVLRKATPQKSLRITWADGKSSLSVNFYSKGTGKSQVVVQHSKLANAETAAKMKSYWAKALDALERLLSP